MEHNADAYLDKQNIYHIFPFSKVNSGAEIILWGFGFVGNHYLNQIRTTGYCSVKYIVDQNPDDKWVNDLEIYPPEKIKEEADPVVVVSIKDNAESVVKRLKEWGVRDENIILADPQLLCPSVLRKQIILSQDDEKYYEELKELFKVHELPQDIGLVRIGKDYDGGYLMADSFDKGNIAYSFGISDDISWDLDMVSRGYDVYMYDHTIGGISGGNDRTHYFKIGLAGKPGEGKELETLDALLEKNGHRKEKGMVLKIDIEGAEWDFLENINPTILEQFEQIVFEFHELVTSDNKKGIVKCLKKLNGTHRCIHIHANNMSSHILKWGNGGKKVLPECIEAVYLKKKENKFGNLREKWKLNELDQPNLKGVNEIDLSDW